MPHLGRQRLHRLGLDKHKQGYEAEVEVNDYQPRVKIPTGTFDVADHFGVIYKGKSKPKSKAPKKWKGGKEKQKPRFVSDCASSSVPVIDLTGSWVVVGNSVTSG